MTLTERTQRILAIALCDRKATAEVIGALNDALTSEQQFTFVSTAGAGGSANEVETVSGLLASDTITSVTLKTPGANSLPLLGYTAQSNGSLTAIFSADPGAGSVIQVSVMRATKDLPVYEG